MRVERVGVLVIHQNNTAGLSLALKCLADAPNACLVSVCLVDAGSKPEDAAQAQALADQYFPQRLPGCLLSLQTTASFAAACNAGIAELARIPSLTHLAILHSDAAVSPGWLEKLLAAGADLAVPVSNEAAGMQWVPVDFTVRQNVFAQKRIAAFAAARGQAFAGARLSAEYVDFFCALFQWETLVRTGKFDEKFAPCYFETEDYCRRLCAQGGKIAVCRDVYVHHFAHGAIQAIPLYYREIYFQQNRLLYEDKHGAAWYAPTAQRAYSLAEDLTFLEKAGKMMPRFYTLCKQGVLALGQTLNALEQQQAQESGKIARGVYPEVPVRLLLGQLRHKAARAVRNFGPVCSILHRKACRAPANYKELLALIAEAQARGQKTVAVLSPFFGDADMSPKDGYIRRVKAIDEDVLTDYYKVYLYEPAVHHPAVLQVELLDAHHAYVKYDTAVPLQKRQVTALIEACGLTYSHSILRLIAESAPENAAARLPLLQMRAKHVWDVHGAVPEEFALCGNVRMAAVAQDIEAAYAQHADVVVTVNHATQTHLQKRYGALSAVAICLPIFNEDISADRAQCGEKPVQDGKPVAVYAGGIQAWQKIDLMQDIMAQCDKQVSYRIFVPEPEAFAQAWAGRKQPAQMVVDSCAPEQLVAEYQAAHYGFVLRDDIAVNHVACPTKLVEYLQYGVVPVLLTDQIGDFCLYGMQYITAQAFAAGQLPEEAARAAMARHNVAVLRRLLTDYETGRSELRNILAQL